jgi:arylsulfatase A-like enzyme
VAAAAAALAAAGCDGPRVVTYDLAARAFVAERWSAREVVLFGTPAATPREAEGFYREGGAPAGDRFRWSKGEAEVALSWAEVAPRAAVVDLAPYRGVKGQAVEVRLNGAAVESFALNDERHRYRVALPASAQRAGENRLRFVFRGTASPADGGAADRRQLAAQFFSLVRGRAGDAGLDDLLARGAPRPFQARNEGGVPVLDQLGPSVVRYSLRLARGAEVRLAPELHVAARAAGGSALVKVVLERAPGREEVLWERRLDGSRPSAGEVRLRPALAGGGIARLGLHVAGDRFAWVSWRAPRVLGPAPDPLRPRPYTPAEQARAEGLRRDLGRVNVLLVLLDAARAGHFGAYGYGRPTTPEVDRIAAEGVVFENAYTPAVYTLGALSSLWTSQYPDRHHAEVSFADRLPPDRLTLAEALGARGLHTTAFVANPMAGRLFAFERGFSEFVEAFSLYPDLGSRGASFARALPEWLSRRPRDRPFLLYLHLREPHFPYDPGPPFDTLFGPDAPLTRDQRRDKAWYTDVNQGRRRPTPEELAHLVRLYDGNLAYADRHVGEVRRLMEAAGAWEETVVMVLADHGEQLHEEGYIGHSAQVREESVRVPLVVRFPAGRGPRGLRVRGLVDLLDVAPTALDLLGVREGPARAAFQGRSLLPMVAGAPGKGAVLSRTVWDLPVYALRDEGFKLVHDTRTGASRLFDLAADPGERDDLAAREPLRTAYYRESLQAWVAALQDAERQARAGAGPAAGGPTREQCELLKTLGYVHSGCP